MRPNRCDHSMEGCFVRGLFGNPCVDGYPGLLGDLEKRSRDFIQPTPCLWFAWGEENAEAIRAAGFEPIVVSDESIPSRGIKQRYADYVTAYGVQPFGYNIFRLKLDAIRLALKDHEHVIWLDMDVELAKPLPSGFWEHLRTGQRIQAPCVQYHRVQCPWRKECRRTSIFCATAYFRHMNTIDRCLDYATANPFAFEQAAINHTIDQFMGGKFLGPNTYKALGFEFPFTEKKGGMIHEPLDPLFRIGSKGWSEWKRKGIEAWSEHVRQLSRTLRKGSSHVASYDTVPDSQCS